MRLFFSAAQLRTQLTDRRSARRARVINRPPEEAASDVPATPRPIAIKMHKPDVNQRIGVSFEKDDERALDRPWVGASVRALHPYGIAVNAGLREGDTVLSVDGTTVNSSLVAAKMLREAEGDIWLSVLRGGVPIDGVSGPWRSPGTPMVPRIGGRDHEKAEGGLAARLASMNTPRGHNPGLEPTTRLDLCLCSSGVRAPSWTDGQPERDLDLNAGVQWSPRGIGERRAGVEPSARFGRRSALS